MRKVFGFVVGLTSILCMLAVAGEKEQAAAIKIQKTFRKSKRPNNIPQEMRTQEVDLSGSDIQALIPTLIDEAKIPGLDKARLYVKDVTNDVSGSKKKQILLIGNQSPTGGDPTILFVMKKIDGSSFGDDSEDDSRATPGELKSIEAAYQTWSRKLGQNPVLTAPDGTRVKLSFHERLFHDKKGGEYYELLHFARGVPLEKFNALPPCVFHECYARDSDQKPVDGSTNAWITGINREKEDIEKTLIERFGKKRPFVYRYDSALGTSRPTLCEGLSGKMEHQELAKLELLFQNIVQISKLYRKGDPTLEFDADGNLKVLTYFQGREFAQRKAALASAGSALGLVMKRLNLDVNSAYLDPHGGNLFHNPEKKEVTWIDLEGLGAASSGRPNYFYDPAIEYALYHKHWLKFFEAPSYANTHLEHSAQVHFSRQSSSLNSLTAQQQEKLFEQRNQLFRGIQELYEAFLDAFIASYSSGAAEKRDELKAQFRDWLKFPYTDLNSVKWDDKTQLRFAR